jgi:hypothetical protein
MSQRGIHDREPSQDIRGSPRVFVAIVAQLVTQRAADRSAGTPTALSWPAGGKGPSGCAADKARQRDSTTTSRTSSSAAVAVNMIHDGIRIDRLSPTTAQ